MELFLSLIVSVASGLLVAVITNWISWYFEKRKQKAETIHSLLSYLEFYSRESNMIEANRTNAINELGKIRLDFFTYESSKDIEVFRKMGIILCSQLRSDQSFNVENCQIDAEKKYLIKRYVQLAHLFSSIKKCSTTWLKQKVNQIH